jgi:hypothetical protein
MTAGEARKLSSCVINKEVEDILALIRASAKIGLRECCLNGDISYTARATLSDLHYVVRCNKVQW